MFFILLGHPVYLFHQDYWWLYRRLNKVTKPDVYPLLNIETLLDRLGGKSRFSELDMSKRLPRSHMWVFINFRLPFSLRNPPATFQRPMNTTIADVLFPRDKDIE